MDLHDPGADIDDDESPEAVGFADSRNSAVLQREKEILSFKAAKGKKKEADRKQHSWFHDQKVAKILRSKKESKNEDLPISKTSTANMSVSQEHESTETLEAAELDEDADMPPLPVLKKKSHAAKRAKRKQASLDAAAMTNSPTKNTSQLSDFIPLDDKNAHGVNVVSMSDLRKNRSIYRPEVLAFASQRFNPLGITRIPAAKVLSVAAKRAVYRRSL